MSTCNLRGYVDIEGFTRLMEIKQEGTNTRPQPVGPLSASCPSAPSPTALAAVFSLVRTERLVLLRPTESDAAAMFAIHGDPRTNLYNPHGPDLNLAASEDTLRQWLRQWDSDGFGYWAVSRSDSSDVIGFGGVRRITWRARDILNLYYRFTPSAGGHGYATETARAAITLASAHLSTLPVIARVRAVNVASVRTAERAGLVRRPDLDTEEHLIFSSAGAFKDPGEMRAGG